MEAGERQTIVNELISFGQETENTIKLRIDYFDNGRVPPKGRTQHGLVIDLDNSAVRYNVNFQVQTEQDIVNAYRSARATTAERATIEAMAERWSDEKLNAHAAAFMATAKINRLAGTGQHDLAQGNKGHDHSVGAILVLDPHMPPWVALYFEGAEVLFGAGWEKVKHSSSPTLKWRNTKNL